MKIIECPRDAIQGFKNFIPTEKKIAYLKLLLESKLFDSLDCGSFVSPKAIPQMADTAQVLKGLHYDKSQRTKLLTIIANERGAEDACKFDEISFLGYPFSISETFQLRNTNATIEESFGRVEAIQNLCEKHNKALVLYISMGFGNPYGDVWNAEIVLKWTEKLNNLGIKIFSLSDTIGMAEPATISYLYKYLIPAYPDLEFGSHFHTTPDAWKEKIEAAWEGGCRRFDGAILGYGGCPMAKDELVGNMPTENLISYLEEKYKAYHVDNQLIINIKAAFNELISA